IGRTRKACDGKFKFIADRAGHAKVKPLIEVGFAILADRKAGGRPVERLHDDVAAIEGGVDADCHGTLIVRPDSPGKSLNKASANLAAASDGCAAGAFTGTAEIARPSHKARPVAASSSRTVSCRSCIWRGPPPRLKPIPSP